MSPTFTRDESQTLSVVLVNNVEPTELSSVAQSVFHEVITPYMVLMLGSQADATPVIKP